MKTIGYIFGFMLLFAVMTILVPALISAKSTVAVIVGFLIAAVVIVGAIIFAVKQFSKINIEDIH